MQLRLKGKPRDLEVYNSTWRVADPAGNETDIQVRVNVVDTTPPMIVVPKTLSLPAYEAMVNLTYPIQILDSARDKIGDLATEAGTIKIVACTPKEIEKALKNAPQVPDGLRDGYPDVDISDSNDIGGNIGPRASAGAGTLAKAGAALGSLALVGAMAGFGILAARKSRKQKK